MAVRTITEILDSVQSRLGDDTSDEAIAFVEDITDTLNDYENKTKSEEDWKKKYEDNDASWRKKYKDRFFGGKPSEEEIDMHIVSFKLDDSIASDGYTLSDELKAIEAGKAFGKYGLPKLDSQDLEYSVPAKYTTEDGKEFTNDTPVNEDITVIVAPAVGD